MPDGPPLPDSDTSSSSYKAIDISSESVQIDIKNGQQPTHKWDGLAGNCKHTC